jgi:hypothetical protein
MFTVSDHCYKNYWRMETMKTTKVEVRTTYHIEVSFEDFVNAKYAWTKDQDALRILYPKAFDNNDMSPETIKKEMCGVYCHGDQAALLAKYFKFDGWENAGYFHKEKNVRCMSVYMNGDTLTK